MDVPAGAIDCGGDLVMPGLVELHTDNLERHIEPRPKVDWPHASAIIAHDAELASVGITTVFDALRVGSVISKAKGNYGEYARALADEILDLRRDVEDCIARAFARHLHHHAAGTDHLAGVDEAAGHRAGHRRAEHQVVERTAHLGQRGGLRIAVLDDVEGRHRVEGGVLERQGLGIGVILGQE